MAATVQSSWCYPTLSMSTSPARSYLILTLGFRFPPSILPSIWLGDGPWPMIQVSFLLLHFGIWLWYHASCVFIYQMTRMAGYLLPVETRCVLGKKVLNKLGFYWIPPWSVLFFSWAWQGLSFSVVCQEDGIRYAQDTPSKETCRLLYT